MHSSSSKGNRLLAIGLLTTALTLTLAAGTTASADGNDVNRNVYFGDLHVHTRNSHDAFLFQAMATPDDAYRYARGHAIKHTLGTTIQLRGEPLDFSAVTDHGELLGVLQAMRDPNSAASELPQAAAIRGDDRKARLKAFFSLLRGTESTHDESATLLDDTVRSAWQETVEAAERHNEPGVFTAFVAYEYSSAPENQNLHRNVFFETAKVPERPFTAIDSENPEDLWRWLDGLRSSGISGLAIPHNSNVSNGLMFQLSDWSGAPLDAAYAALRMRNEPLVEITQVKGTSETHPLLSPNDEWADFELYDTLIASDVVADKPGGFVREAYRHGLEFQSKSGFNPYEFGLIGASDTHNAGGATEEFNYVGKVGALDGTAKLRGTTPDSAPATFGAADATSTFKQWSASGLTGIWAEENTRQSLFAAMQRKETFATSGPRIVLRFFAGFDYGDQLLTDPDITQNAYQRGVAMGGILHANDGKRPSFLLWAARDRHSGMLQRLQVVKGWVTNGRSFEQVYDVACGDGRNPDPQSHRCSNSDGTTDMSTCEPDIESGAEELLTVWQDPNFNASEHAFYYARVLENPTCRWSTWDALRAGAEPQAGMPTHLQERAWSSPIWYRPE